MYDIEKYYQATGVEDAIRALCEDERAMVISGGSDVLIQCREGRLAGCSLVSIHGIEELMGIEETGDGEIIIRAATVFSHIANSPVIQRTMPMLAYAVDQVGGPQIRNIGTIGGNVCNGVTSADSASSLWALNATLELRGPQGTRTVPIRDFYTGAGKTVRKQNEILVAIHIEKKDYDGFGGCYLKYGKREAMEIATLGCAAMTRLTPDKTALQELRLAYGVAAPTPMRCWNTEAAVQGARIDAELIERIATGALSEVKPRTSWRASREFRLQLVSELCRRAVRQAIINAGGMADV
ncbi:MAG TPA: xanthine dehydrogenase FAD-binding subunit XdhB [Candidatus Limiplasma sp.]|nr:xanthine dehydrogenase FAD-binding subunit XdhB [Candidatus Limiplasma sp.]